MTLGVHCVWSESGSDEAFLEHVKEALSTCRELESLVIVYDPPSDERGLLQESTTPWLQFLYDTVFDNVPETLKTVAFDIPWESKYRESDGLTEFVFKSCGPSASEQFGKIMKRLEDLANGGVVEVTMCGEFRRSMLFVTLETVSTDQLPRKRIPTKTFESLSEAMKNDSSIVGVTEQKWTIFETKTLETAYVIKIPIPIPAKELQVTFDDAGRSVKIWNAPYDWRNSEAIPKVFTSTTFFVPDDVNMASKTFLKAEDLGDHLLVLIDRVRPEISDIRRVPISAPKTPPTWIDFFKNIYSVVVKNIAAMYYHSS